MKKSLIAVALIAATLATATARKGDPVLMTVNGKDVPVSEFEYLFNKNNQQQAEPQSLDQYVDLFVNYKLKVADAEANGIDTTASFIKEYTGYCDDLAQPYLTDSAVVDVLRHEAYDRMQRNVRVSHIMLPLGRTPDERIANRERLDSIRTAILNGADFGEMAVKYSSDRSAVKNHGDMGFIMSGGFPYPFELASYNTPIGQISEVVEDAPYGWHIIKVTDERPDRGRVLVRHILKLTRDLSPEEQAAKKAAIDSIYEVVKSGKAPFDHVAMIESEDPGSAKKGGMLPLFGPGRMVKEFEEASYALNDGEISEPIQTSYGWHIIQKLETRKSGTYEEALPAIDKSMKNDIRAKAPREAKIRQLRKEYKADVKPAGIDKAKAIIKANNGLDSLAVAQMAADWTTVATVGNRKVLLGDVAKTMPSYPSKLSEKAAAEEFNNALDRKIDDVTVDIAREKLADTDPDYRNLINEYRDGILLFNISDREVWGRSTKDAEGLEEYFKSHRDNYHWDAPRYKGIIVSATNDSIASAARDFIKVNNIPTDSLVNKLRKEFGRAVKVERKIFPKGEDEVVDYIAFGGAKPAANGRWTEFFATEGAVIDQPSESLDVRAAVINDYQKWLEEEWLKRLHQAYPVKINQKELKKLTENKAKKK